jgi:hypothetical protein
MLIRTASAIEMPSTSASSTANLCSSTESRTVTDVSRTTPIAGRPGDGAKAFEVALARLIGAPGFSRMEDL